MCLQEKQKLLDEIEDLTVQLTEEQENKRKMGDKLSHERHQFQKEKESTQEVRSLAARCSPALLKGSFASLASAASPEPTFRAFGRAWREEGSTAA